MNPNSESALNSTSFETLLKKEKDVHGYLVGTIVGALSYKIAAKPYKTVKLLLVPSRLYHDSSVLK